MGHLLQSRRHGPSSLRKKVWGIFFTKEDMGLCAGSNPRGPVVEGFEIHFWRVRFSGLGCRSQMVGFGVKCLVARICRGSRQGRCRAKMAHVRQSGPDSSLGFRKKVHKHSKVFPLRSKAEDLRSQVVPVAEGFGIDLLEEQVFGFEV